MSTPSFLKATLDLRNSGMKYPIIDLSQNDHFHGHLGNSEHHSEKMPPHSSELISSGTSKETIDTLPADPGTKLHDLRDSPPASSSSMTMPRTLADLVSGIIIAQRLTTRVSSTLCISHSRDSHTVLNDLIASAGVTETGISRIRVGPIWLRL